MRFRRFCREGHDLNATNARHWNGDCKVCEPAPTHCRKGHDITAPDSHTFIMRPDGRVRMTCHKCADSYRAWRKSQRATCPKGHVVNVSGSTHADGSCKRCRQERAKAEKAEALLGKTKRRTMQQDREDTLRTRRMLDLITEINRCSTHMDREPLEAEFARLQAMSTGGDE